MNIIYVDVEQFATLRSEKKKMNLLSSHNLWVKFNFKFKHLNKKVYL